MNKKTISFDRHKATHGQLLKLYEEGYKVICPLCKSEIVFSKNAGSWCSKNPNHYATHIYTVEARESLRAISQKYEVQELTENLHKKDYTEEQIQAEIDKYYPETSKER